MAARPTIRGSVAAALRPILGPARSGGPVAAPAPRPTTGGADEHRRPTTSGADEHRRPTTDEGSKHRPSTAPSAAPERPPGTWSDGAMGSPEAALVAALGQRGRPALRLLYVDELEGAHGSARPKGYREVYLSKLPWHDYSEQELLAWLQDFGPTEEVHFIRDAASDQLTGGGYARFRDAEDAAGLVESCEDGPGPRASWSVSEELLRRGELLGGASASILARLRAELRCPSLALVGEARRGGRALEALGLATGPLRFAWAVDGAGSGPSREVLVRRLGAVVREVFCPGEGVKVLSVKSSGAVAVKAAAVKSSGAAAAPAAASSVPYIFVQGFPASWSEAQVRLVFTVFGGVSTVNVLPGEGSRNRMAYLKLKEPRRSADAVRQLNNTEVGDGDVIEKCTLRCQLLGGAAPAPAPAAPRAATEPPRAATEPRRTTEPVLRRPETAPRRAEPAPRTAEPAPAPRSAETEVRRESRGEPRSPRRPIGSFALSRASDVVEEPPAKRRRAAHSMSPLANPLHRDRRDHGEEEERHREGGRRREERGTGRRQRRHERPRLTLEPRSPSPCALRLEPARHSEERHRRVRKITLLEVSRR